MSGPPPPVVPRKPSVLRVMIPPGEQPPPAAVPIYSVSVKENRAKRDSNHVPTLNAEREVSKEMGTCAKKLNKEILNHCFDDVERFMGRLQQAAEAQSVLNQRKKKRSRKSKKGDQEDNLLTMKAVPPPEEDFVNIFQKIKYSFSLLDRLKSSITQPDAPDLLHHVFVPLRLMVNTTGGPELGMSVLSPALTSGAVSLLQEHLTTEEKELWTSLGPNWTSDCSHLNVSVPPYSPVFLDGWEPPAYDSSGQPLEDPIESQHKQDALREREAQTAQVIESSKRWWKCRNRFDQIGFVPFNILEPLSALSDTGRGSPVMRTKSTRTPLSPPARCFSYTPSSGDSASPTATSPPLRPQSMVLPSTALGEDSDRVLIMNDELLQRLAEKRSSVRPLVIPRTADTAAPLNYHSPPAEVEAWLTTKGFSPQTIERLGVLSGAQLFSLNKEELRAVSQEEGARVYSQIMVQKALLEDVRKATELETVMEKQKMKIGLKSESNEV
ncbi:hypothetical protein INR49_011234 [Caranx melampygus]|nr:hypothetical protein INR49_011234 [Caranx melampygus]